MRKPFWLGLLALIIIVALSQDPYIGLPNWAFVLALAGGVVIVLLSLLLGLLSLA